MTRAIKRSACALSIALAVCIRPALAQQTPGVMTIPRPAGTAQCDSASALPGTVAGRLGGGVTEAGQARLLIVPASDTAEYFFTALAQATRGAMPTAKLPFNPNDPNGIMHYADQLREMQQQMRIVPLFGNGSFHCGGFAPGRYLIVIQFFAGGRRSFYKAYATIPTPRIPGQRFTVNPTQPQPMPQ